MCFGGITAKTIRTGGAGSPLGCLNRHEKRLKTQQGFQPFFGVALHCIFGAGAGTAKCLETIMGYQFVVFNFLYGCKRGCKNISWFRSGERIGAGRFWAEYG
jgi:hypothetical protein